MSNKVLGLDIGSKNTKLVLAQTGKKLSIIKTYLMETPQGCIIEGEIKNTDLVAAAIKNMISEKRIKADGLYFSINLPNALIRDIKLPLLKNNEIEPAVEFELSQSFPGVAQTHTISFKIQKTTETSIEGIAAFCPTKQLDVYVELAKKIGLTLKSISINAETICKAYNYVQDEGKDAKPVIIVDIGHNNSQVSIVEGDKLIISRSVSSGCSAIDTIVSSRFDISVDKAERARINNKYSIYDMGEQDIQTINRLGLTAIEDQIRQTLDYYNYNNPKEAINKIVVIGAGNVFAGLDKYFSDTFNLPVVFSENKTSYKENLQLFYPAIGACLTENELFKDLNLIPYLKTMRLDKLKAGRFSIVVAFIASFAVLSLAAYAVMYFMGNSYTDREAALMEDFNKYSEVNIIKNSISSTEGKIGKINALLEATEKNTFSSVDILKNIGSVMPDSIFSVSYSFDGEKITISGKSSNRTSISDFLYKLKELPDFATVLVSSITSVMNEDGSIMNYDFIVDIEILRQVK